MIINNCGCHNVWKHIEIKGSDKSVTLYKSLKSDSMDKIKITSSDSKNNLGRSGKGLITSLALKAKARPHKYKKVCYAIRNVSKKDLSKIIREFEKLPYESYERNRLKHEPSDSYFYLAWQISKCMMRADARNLRSYPVRPEMTAKKQILTSHAFSTDEIELK